VGPSDFRNGMPRLNVPETHAPQREVYFLEDAQRGSFGRRFLGFHEPIAAWPLPLRRRFLAFNGFVTVWSFPLPPAEVPRAFDMLAPVCLFGPKLIVGSAADTKVLRFVAATKRPWVGVVELEKSARLAATTVR
jgi:hypothetical protein